MMIFSATWLENGFILTSCHFFLNRDYSVSTKNEILKQMASSTNSRCIVSSASASDKPGMIYLLFNRTQFVTCIDYTHPADTHVYLVQADFSSNIALFRTFDDKATTHSNKYHVKSDQLAAFEHQSPPTTGLSIWSTAYCGNNDELDTDNGIMFLKTQKGPEDVKKGIRRTTQSVFGYEQSLFKRSCNNTQWKSSL